jgi:hypothetical protein
MGTTQIGEGTDGRWYVVLGSNPPLWLASFPSHQAAQQWLQHKPTRDARGRPNADDAFLKKLGGEWAPS